MSFFPLLNTEQGGGDLDPRTAIEGSFSAGGGGGLGKPDRGLGRGGTFFPDSGSDRDSDENFQISRKLSQEHAEFFCLLDSQPCFIVLVDPQTDGYTFANPQICVLSTLLLSRINFKKNKCSSFF